MSYSDALEQQVATLSWMQSREAKTLFERLGNADGFSRTDFAKDAVTTLEFAEPYYWAPAICELMQATSGTIPDWTLLPDSLPSRSGWFYFSKPLRYPSRGDDRVKISAISWSSYAEGAFFTVWWQTPETARIKTWGLPMGGHAWRYGQTMESVLRDIPAYAPDETGARNGRDETAMVATCLAFIGQRILITPQQRAERHARKRVEALGWTHEPLVRVVELRRKASPSVAGADPKTVAWSHQWVVSGHWRQQWYSSIERHQPIWVMPYLKGPEDRPLKAPRAKVFAVVR